MIKQIIRYLAISVAALLLVSGGALAQPLDSATVPVVVEIGAYGAIVATDMPIPELDGSVGVYLTSNGSGVESHFASVLPLWPLPATVLPSGGYAEFDLEFNTDIDVTFSFVGTPWLTSPTAFFVSDIFQVFYGSYFNESQTLTVPLSYSTFGGLFEGYIDAAIYIENIAQQPAGNYGGQITITMAAQP